MLPTAPVAKTPLAAGLQAGFHRVRAPAYHALVDMAEQPLATAEFLAVDTETNGLGGDACEITEVGAVLVGGGELHDRWDSLVRTAVPLRGGIQRFTGITQAMVDAAPPPEAVLPELARRLERRILVAHNASFDRRVLQQAFERVGMQWPAPPVLCTAGLARALLPLQRERRLGALAEALGVEVELAHRALADAETCARILCALFKKLCASVETVADAVALVTRPRRRKQPRPPDDFRLPAGADRLPQLDFGDLPRDPGVYVFRDQRGEPLYVGKSISIRSRARAHFAPSTGPSAWTAHAALVDYQATSSELGALVLENRLIKELRPPGNQRLRRVDDRLVYIRCRLDIAFPVLEVAPKPAAGHAVTIGPLRGRRLAAELVEQLDSIFALRHCGRRLARREHPSAYGQMGRCLSPCLGDLDPNLYRRRLDEALRLFLDGDPTSRILAHVESQMRAAATALHYERASWLRRRLSRLRTIFRALEGVLEASHARPRLVLAPHPTEPRFDAFWLIGGRLAHWGPLTGGVRELEVLTRAALARADPLAMGAFVPAEEIDEVRLVATYLAARPQTPQLVLDPQPDRAALQALLGRAAERKLDHGPPDAVLAHQHL